MNDNTLQKLIETYEAKGHSEEEITKLCQELIVSAMKRFSQEMMKSLTADDLKAIEAITDKKQAEEEALKRYREMSKKDPEEEVKKIVGSLIEESLQKLAASPVTP